ncbi:MAG: hypothetical protein AAF997_12575 [Myxococcota bacterium]
MTPARRRMLIGIGTLVFALGVGAGVWYRSQGETAGWHPSAEGFLAVATPCCEAASLWDDLRTETHDGQRGRAVTVSEAAAWLDTWPYREREDETTVGAQGVAVALRSEEVRCVGAARADDVPLGDDTTTLESLRGRQGCSFARWQVWAEPTAAELPHERHTIWADEDGLFHGRVDHWND